MEYEESMSMRESDEEFASLDPVRRSYLTFLGLMRPVFSNSYQGVLSHVLFPLVGLILLLTFAIMKNKYNTTWKPVQPYVSPLLWIIFGCQCIRYFFFIYNLSIGSERVPTTRSICSLATYAFSALNYLPHFSIALILAHRICSLHIRAMSIRELHYAIGGMLVFFIVMNIIHFNSTTLEMSWICRPYRFNETVLTVLHWLLNSCIVVNPLASLYLCWAERYQAVGDRDAKQSMDSFLLLVSTWELLKIASKWTIGMFPIYNKTNESYNSEMLMGYWYYVKNFIYIDETLHSMYFCIVLTFLFVAFKEFREQMWAWVRFTKKPKVDVTTGIVL